MKRTLLAAAAFAGTLLLAACGSSNSSSHSPNPTSAMPGMGASSMSSPTSTATPSSSSTAAAGPHNSQDINFATDMIQHHGQAVTMADIALSKASNSAVKRLAASIKAAQSPEIKIMADWLTAWGTPKPSMSMSKSMHHGGMSMPGTMSGADMASLNQATGSAFDRLWLKQMITHHRGAVTMARTELTSGRSTAAKNLAKSIVTSQSREISQMTQVIATMK